MFSSISGSRSTKIQNRFSIPVLTKDEKFALAEILSHYDASHYTAADARSLQDEMSKAGIWPSLAIQQTLQNIGFDITRFPLKRRVHRPTATGKDGDQKRIAAALAPLQAVVSHYDLANMSPADEISFYNRLREAGLTR